jgi:hypothetical protein
MNGGEAAYFGPHLRLRLIEANHTYRQLDTPSPVPVQNIENKGAEKILPCKILHPNDLEVKYSTQRSYWQQP